MEAAAAAAAAAAAVIAEEEEMPDERLAVERNEEHTHIHTGDTHTGPPYTQETHTQETHSVLCAPCSVCLHVCHTHLHVHTHTGKQNVVQSAAQRSANPSPAQHSKAQHSTVQHRTNKRTHAQIYTKTHTHTTHAHIQYTHIPERSGGGLPMKKFPRSGPPVAMVVSIEECADLEPPTPDNHQAVGNGTV